MWKRRYLIAVGLCLLLTSWLLTQALYHRIALQETASPDTEVKPAPALKENNSTEASQARNHLPVHGDAPTQKMTPLPAAGTTALASAAGVRQAQRVVEAAQKDTATAAAIHLLTRELMQEAARSVGGEFPASVEETVDIAAAVASNSQTVDSLTIADVQTTMALSAAVVQQPFVQVEAEAFAPSMQPTDSSTIAVVYAAVPPAAANVQQPVGQAATRAEAEAILLSTQPEDAKTMEEIGKTPLSVIAQNGVDEEQIYEDILHLIKSKMALNQSSPAIHLEPAIVLASHDPARTQPVLGLRPVEKIRLARHGFGLAIGTALPNMAEKVRIPVFAEMHYRYQSTPRTQLQLAAGATPILWPAGRQTLQMSADLIGRYGLFVHQRVHPNLSFGLGLLSTRMQSGPPISSGILFAGGGVNLLVAQQWNLGLQVQYKYCLQSQSGVSSMRRDGYLQIKTELTFNLRQLSSIRLRTEENYLADKQ
ncbi:MAG TPA: hypothetical protein PK843_05035 [bacterium]|nr:hypothetical protein [bacterium]